MFERSIQIAGIRSIAEARLLEGLGVTFLGFPLELGYHTPDVSHEEARAIIGELKDPGKAVLITYLTTAKSCAELAAYLGVSIVQLHGDISPDEIKALKRHQPALSIIKSLIVRPEHEADESPLLEEAQRCETHVDAFITDTFDPKTTATGATGKTHNWNISRALAASLQKPLLLAGGLNPGNVASAIAEVRPSGVDAHTGVEDELGNKSESLVSRFVAEARRGFNR